jgi:hypothetical protein
MELTNYLGLKVKILLKWNNYYYVGVVSNADEFSLDLVDIKGQQVSLSKDIILSIQEVSSNA